MTTTTAPAPLTGDVNLDQVVDVSDAQDALAGYVRRFAGLDSGLTDRQMQAGDVNQDGTLTVEDAQFILMYYVKNSVAQASVTWDEILGTAKKKRPAIGAVSSAAVRKRRTAF